MQICGKSGGILLPDAFKCPEVKFPQILLNIRPERRVVEILAEMSEVGTDENKRLMIRDPFQRLRRRFCCSVIQTPDDNRNDADLIAERNLKERELDLHTVLGSDDPVGGYGKGVRKIYKMMKQAGCYNVDIKLLHGARHEIINDLKGAYVTTFAKRKLAMRSGETDIAEIVDSSEFVKTANIISNNLKHIGVLDCDCFKTDSGDLIILEMNCRFGGQYPFSHIAGADVPKQIINWLEGKDTDMSLLNPRIGVKCCKEVVPVEML